MSKKIKSKTTGDGSYRQDKYSNFGEGGKHEHTFSKTSADGKQYILIGRRILDNTYHIQTIDEIENGNTDNF